MESRRALFELEVDGIGVSNLGGLGYLQDKRYKPIPGIPGPSPARRGAHRTPMGPLRRNAGFFTVFQHACATDSLFGAWLGRRTLQRP